MKGIAEKSTGTSVAVRLGMEATAPLVRGPISERRQHGVELFVFLLLVLPSLALSLIAQQAEELSFVVVAVATALRDVALVSLVLFFLWRNGEPRARIGWTTRKLPREVGIGVVLFPGAAMLVGAVVAALHAAGLSALQHPPRALSPHGPAQTALAVVLVAIVAVAEETVFRGYLLGRIRELTRSQPLAILLSTAIFTLGHGYEGAAGMAGVFVLGLVFALVYVWRKSLVAPITMHFVQDIVAMVLLPHFGTHAAT